MTPPRETTCPGCGARLPESDRPANVRYFNASRECWIEYADVLGAEYANPALFGAVHQLTVDAYAVQHAGGPHPDKSVVVHLCGLHLVLDRGVCSSQAPKYLQRLASAAKEFPHFEPPAHPPLPAPPPPPESNRPLTIRDIAQAEPPQERIALVRTWARQVWSAWAEHHAAVQQFLRAHVPAEALPEVREDRTPV